MSMVSTVCGWTPPHKNFKKLYFCWVVPELQLPSTSFLRNPQTLLVCIDQGPDVVYSSSGSWESCGNLPIKFSGHFQRLKNETLKMGWSWSSCCTAWLIDLTTIKDFYQQNALILRIFTVLSQHWGLSPVLCRQPALGCRTLTPNMDGWWLMASSRLTAESRSWFWILIVEGCMLHYIKSSLFACQLVVVYFTNHGPEVIRWQKQIT